MSGLHDALAVAIGGAAGALVRWWLTVLAASVPGGSPPIGTTVANIVGCGLIGGMVVLMANDPAAMDRFDSNAWHQWPRVQLTIRVGLIGALTTFSTFIAEAASFWTAGRFGPLSLYLICNLVLGTAAFAVVTSVFSHDPV